MMIALTLLPVALSLLVLAAHFLRVGNYVVVLGLVCLVPLLALRRAWVANLARLVLWLGAAVWVYSIAIFTGERLRLGQPWLRMALILGGVAAFSLLSSLVFRAGRLRAWYRVGGAEDARPPGV